MSFSTDRLPALDGVRAFAVLLVILGHSKFASGVPGDVGVTAFFVLSGFLITWLLVREHDRTGTVSIKNFYLRRTFRIFPAYYAYIIFSITLDYALHVRWSPGLLAAGVTYTMNYYNAALGHPTTALAHAWSLAVEEQFYLLWPLAFVALWTRGGGRTTRRGLWIAIALVVAWRATAFLILHSSTAYVYNAFETRCDALAIGCVLGTLFGTPAYTAIQTAVTRFVWLPLVTIAAITVSRLALPASYHYALGFTIESLLIAVLLVQLMTLSDSPAWGWLNTRALTYLGAISYPCYLYHGWGFAVAGKIVRHGPDWLLFLGGYAATVALATFSYRVIERPALALRARYTRRPPATFLTMASDAE